MESLNFQCSILFSAFFDDFDLNSAIELLGVILFVLALFLQKRELRLQRKELEAQREQLSTQTTQFKKTATAQNKYADAMELSNKNTNKLIALNEIQMHFNQLEALGKMSEYESSPRPPAQMKDINTDSIRTDYVKTYNQILELMEAYSNIYGGGYISVDKEDIGKK